MDFCDVRIASRNSGQLGAPAVPGRRGTIRQRLGYVLKHAVRCSTLFLWSDWTLSSWRNTQRKIGALSTISGSVDVGTRCREPGGRDRRNIVERCLDELYTLGTARFGRLLNLHLYFQVRLQLQALKMGVFG